MRIVLCPQRHDDLLHVAKAGDILTINGDAFDFTGLPDGATIDAEMVPCAWIIGTVARIDGALHLTLLLPHGPNPSEAVAFPAALIDPPDGPLDLPRDPEPELQEEEPANVEA